MDGWNDGIDGIFFVDCSGSEPLFSAGSAAECGDQLEEGLYELYEYGRHL